MALTIGDNFSYLGAKPLDGRIKYNTISAMVAMTADTLYDGIMAYCVEDGKEYQWKSTNTADPTLGKWREFKTDVPTAYTSTPEMDGTGSAGSSTEWAKGDHVHPSDTTKADASTVNGILDGTTLDSFGDVETALADKADKVSSATSGNFAGLDANGDLTDSGKAPTDLTGIGVIAPAFDSTATYNIGDRCTYNGAFYKFTAAHTGAWVAADATEITVNEAILSNTIGIGGGYAPVGTTSLILGSTAPQDYLECDGSVYNIAAYPQLAAYIESQFGSKNYFGGNGTTTFAVPTITSSVTGTIYCIKAICAGEVYSTEEREDGTWIDGKVIYKKTINFGAMPNNTTKSVSAGIGANVVGDVISMYGTIKGGSGSYQFYDLPTARPDGTDIAVRYASSTDMIECITTDNWSNYSGYITIRYTKTT